MRQATRTKEDRRDVAEVMADLAGVFFDAGSEEEIFGALAEHFTFSVWEIEGPVLRARHLPDLGETRSRTTDAVLPLDAVAFPPRFFDAPRFHPLPAEIVEMLLYGPEVAKERATLRTARTGEAGVVGPISVEGTPWGVMTVRWSDPCEHELGLFTMVAAYLGVALRLLANRRGILRANQELRAVHTLARDTSDPSSLYLPILQSAAFITDSATAVLFLTQNGSGDVALAGHFGGPCEWTKGNLYGRDEYFAQALAAQEPTPIERIRPEQPAIVLYPLVVEKRNLGILLLARPERDYSAQEIARAGLLAAQLAVQLENASLLEETKRKNEVLSTLYRLGRLLAQSSVGDLPLSGALDLLVKGLDYAGAWLYVREGEDHVLRAESGAGRPPALDGIEACNGDRSGRTLVQGDDGVQYAILPLDAAGHPVGCLVVARQDGTMRDHDWELLESYGAQIALAMERSRLAKEERARVQQLRFLLQVGRIATAGRLDKRKLLHDFLHQTAASLGYELGLGLFPASGEELTIGGSPDSPLFPTMRKLAAAVSTSLCDVREVQAEWEGRTVFVCAMPVRGPEGVQAVFALARHAGPTSLQEFETLAAATTNLGFALEDAVRFEKAQQTLDEMRLVLDVGKAITSSSNLDELLHTTARIVNQLVGASHTAMLVLDDHTDELRCEALYGETPCPVRRGKRFPGGRSLLDRYQSVIASAEEAPPEVQRYFAEKGIRSSFAVQMRLLEKRIGCIWVMDLRGPRRWTSAEIERVEVIAHQIAIAVANTRLHDDLRHSHLELARAQEELIKKERLAALGELSAVVAHEVRNPLGVIFNSLGSLKRLIEPRGDVQTLLEIVEEEANRLDRIVVDLLDFARPNPIEPEWTDLGELVEHALATFPIPDGIELDLRVAPSLPQVYIDARLIRQAFVNLVQNAIHAMPKGGTLRLSVDRNEENGRETVELSVEDQGTGIPEELQHRIFEPFFTTKATGSGLGLALVKRIVEAHQGRLDFHSRLGEGSRFTIVLEALVGV